MKLVNEATQREIKIGDEVKTFRGEKCVVEAMHEPHKPSASGKVTVRFPSQGYAGTYYVGVIGAVWVD